ncbi:uncharacterized protein I303_105518 [Kwoniella dejecticola CBS 10117]|uniref:Scavenger mRNA-decapping enzyme DcpS n=1 Tax=Kwoniella dejecticola CBS 10117 TaxID=1296121 RepID=A0A1A6A298_9TREE|nr:scavenger mRNA-decapping enzyme DcpS [Kwoniella dejecticola CBS 10117]OBR84183.1 scavenger mRNA-decapping enzyme DcpS [Kwoniella dejecticola CBS 10117]
MCSLNAEPLSDASRAAEISVDSLAKFTPTRILSESTSTGSIYILGTLHDSPAIVHIQKTVLESAKAGDVLRGLEKIDLFLENQPYFSSHAWIRPTPDRAPDLQIKIICPATETHIKKYSEQERFIVCETPEIYRDVVLGYINGFDESRLGWVYAILDGRKEAERILYRKEGDEEGFVILPDLKWDQTSMNALYLTVLVQTRSIKSLRDLTRSHIPLLNSIKEAVYDTAKQKYGVGAGKLRLFVHYQPSYYHFHVHVVHIQSEAFAGMLVGQAHMLDDLITLLELSPPDGPSLLAQKTYTYPLGVEHGLFEGMKAAGAILD